MENFIVITFLKWKVNKVQKQNNKKWKPFCSWMRLLSHERTGLVDFVLMLGFHKTRMGLLTHLCFSF